MNYSVAEIKDEQRWEAFMQEQRPHTFLHSWKWGLQYEHSGSKIFRLGVYRAEQLMAVALLIKINARRGAFLLCPHGPTVARDADAAGILKVLVEELLNIGQRERCDFIRICPLQPVTEKSLYASLGFRPAPIHMHPELSWLLDITKDEETLLKEMRKTTRYLIKKSEKDRIEITMRTDPEAMEDFWKVYKATADRQHYTPFSKSYLKQEFDLFAKDNQAAFFFGTYQGTIIAASIIIFYNGSAYYHHSGSLQIFPHLNASSLLQWRAIQEAKRRGCTLYNFWGISPDNKPKHPWAGLSLFKKGFGGFPEEYVHAQDLPLTKKYWLNFAIETFRRLKRGL